MPRKRNRSSDSSSSSSSSSEEDFAETKKKSSKSFSKIVPSDSSSSSDDDDGEWNAKPKVKSKPKRNKITPKKPLKASKKKLKSSLSDSEDNSRDRKRSEEKEEGEVDFSDDELEEFNDGFDDNLMGDEEDQRKLSQMTEKEREQELFNRSEKREVLKTRFEIEKKLRLAKKQVNKTDSKENNTENNKNNNNDKPVVDKASDNLVFLDHSASRSVERRRNMEDKRKVKDAMKGLKAEREKKKLKQKLKAADVFSDSSDSNDSEDEAETNTEQRKITKKSIKKSSTSEDYSSSSSVSDDDDVESTKKSDSRKRDNDWDHKFDHNDRIEQFDFTIEHLNSIRVSRFKMEKWCHAPFFKDTVMDSFVRIGVGNTANISQYIVGQIVDVVETPKIYFLGKTRTNKGIKLKHGNNMEKVFRLEYVSNSEFTVDEFEQWRTKMISGRCDFPTKDLVENKKIDIQKAINYNYSDEDVVMIVAEKERFKNKPVNFAMKKTQLLKDKEYAEMKGDHEKASEISKEIDRLEEESKKLDKLRTQSIASISFINERNRMKNIKEAERAIAEAAKEAQNNKDDPFTRRKCTPTMISVVKNKQDKQAPQNENQSNPEENNNSQTIVADKDNVPDSSQPDPIMDMDAKNQSNNNANNNNNNNNDNDNNNATKPSDDANDMFSVHDFDIKIDFNGLNNVAGWNSANSSTISNSSTSFSNNFPSGASNGFANARSNPMSNSATNRRSLNLDEYKKKKGLI